jgi:hypothetical protein
MKLILMVSEKATRATMKLSLAVSDKSARVLTERVSNA